MTQWYEINCNKCREIIAMTYDSLMFTASIHCPACAEIEQNEEQETK